MPDKPETPPLKENEFNLVIVNPDQVLFENQAKRIIVPTQHSELAILPNHTPLYAQIKPGTITVDLPNGKTDTYEVDGGVIRVRSNQVSVVVGFETKEEGVN